MNGVTRSFVRYTFPSGKIVRAFRPPVSTEVAVRNALVSDPSRSTENAPSRGSIHRATFPR